jgi:hypothetical protein
MNRGNRLRLQFFERIKNEKSTHDRDLAIHYGR